MYLERRRMRLITISIISFVIIYKFLLASPSSGSNATTVIGWSWLRSTSSPEAYWSSILDSYLLSNQERLTTPLIANIALFQHHQPLTVPGIRPYGHRLAVTSSQITEDLDTFFPIPEEGEETVLTLATIASHERDYLVEWITWHRLVGVERFVLFDVVPGGDEGLKELLRPWREEGVVVLVECEWPDADEPGTQPLNWHPSLLNFISNYFLPSRTGG
ncbi:hypothetical protein T439DRAFT_155786 [Meredithblackwellia eburnea MCA 4105]